MHEWCLSFPLSVQGSPQNQQDRETVQCRVPGMPPGRSHGVSHRRAPLTCKHGGAVGITNVRVGRVYILGVENEDPEHGWAGPGRAGSGARGKAWRAEERLWASPAEPNRDPRRGTEPARVTPGRWTRSPCSLRRARGPGASAHRPSSAAPQLGRAVSPAPGPRTLPMTRRFAPGGGGGQDWAVAAPLYPRILLTATAPGSEEMRAGTVRSFPDKTRAESFLQLHVSKLAFPAYLVLSYFSPPDCKSSRHDSVRCSTNKKHKREPRACKV